MGTTLSQHVKEPFLLVGYRGSPVVDSQRAKIVARMTFNCARSASVIRSKVVSVDLPCPHDSRIRYANSVVIH